MKREELEKELQMGYHDLNQYLIQKYGGAVCDYFATPECKSVSKKISRTKEGLYCHHIDEDKGGNLASAFSALHQPFEWQKKERLAYCNVLEHLVLHIKIAILRHTKCLTKPSDVLLFFTTGGIFELCKEINDMYCNNGTSVAWKQRCFEEIKENYEDYILLLQTLLSYIHAHYKGDKTAAALLNPGSVLSFPDGECQVLKVSADKSKILLSFPSGEAKSLDTDYLTGSLPYADCFDLITCRMCKGYETFYRTIYDDVMKENGSPILSQWRDALKVDYQL